MAKSAAEVTRAGYAHPEVLVDTQWVIDHLNDPKVKIVEVDVDTSAYDTGHIKGAIGLDWRKDLQARPVRDLLPKDQLEKLLSSKGISAEDAVLVYGDNNNWFAAWFVWNLKYYGHKDARLINGGRKKWQDEGRELVTDAPSVKPAELPAVTRPPARNAGLSEASPSSVVSGRRNSSRPATFQPSSEKTDIGTTVSFMTPLFCVASAHAAAAFWCDASANASARSFVIAGKRSCRFSAVWPIDAADSSISRSETKRGLKSTFSPIG